MIQPDPALASAAPLYYGLGTLVLVAIAATARTTLKRIDRLADDVANLAQQLASIKTELVGLNGDNGLTSRVRNLEVRGRRATD